MTKGRQEGMGGGQVAADELRLLIERWERLDEERKAIVDDQKDVMAEAKGRGFDPKIMREIIRLRKMKPEERREREALIDTYRAALGMLDGTPLGTWAIERLSKPRSEATPPSEDADSESAPVPAPEPEAQPAPEPALTIDDAKRLGGEAARAGKPVTSNPFPARDIRRAAWDEAWCHELGSDGMDIPDALKPSPKPKGGKPGEEPKAA